MWRQHHPRYTQIKRRLTARGRAGEDHSAAEGEKMGSGSHSEGHQGERGGEACRSKQKQKQEAEGNQGKEA